MIALPGPSVLLTVGHSISFGWKHAVSTVAGATMGIAAQLIITIIGLSSLLKAVTEAFEWLRQPWHDVSINERKAQTKIRGLLMVFSRRHHGKTPVIITRTIEPFENQLKSREIIDRLLGRLCFKNLQKSPTYGFAGGW